MARAAAEQRWKDDDAQDDSGHRNASEEAPQAHLVSSHMFMLLLASVIYVVPFFQWCWMGNQLSINCGNGEWVTLPAMPGSF